MPFKFLVGKCQQTLSEMTIWPRYDQIYEDNCKLKSTFQQNVLMHDGGSSWVLMSSYVQKGCQQSNGMIFHCRKDENNFQNIFDYFGGQKTQF